MRRPTSLVVASTMTSYPPMRGMEAARALGLWCLVSGCGTSTTRSPADVAVDAPWFDATSADRPFVDDVPTVIDRHPARDVALPGDGAWSACRTSAACAAGEFCDGEPGCSAVVWSCRPGAESCSAATSTYCGCDGSSFQASVDCPGRQYQHLGPCTASITHCELPSGALCPVGMTCPSGDGCNDCTCASAGTPRCTTRPCAADAGLSRTQCYSAIDCPEGERCVVEAGCAMPSTCLPASSRFCADDAVAWCGCDGRTFYGSSTCPPQRYAARGACGTTDAGAPSVDCDPSHTVCAIGGGPCPAGQVRSVVRGCFGYCVYFAACAPIRCVPGTRCPGGTTCDADAGTCQLTAP